MSFTKQNNNQTENKPDSGIVNTIANYLPVLTLVFEQMTGQSIPQAKGTLADILTALQRLENKVDDLEKNCAEQFISQEKQLTSLQQISKLVSTEKTKAIHFTNPKQITEIEENV
ncbi:2413_t:CDS:1 [Ambispora gerdemannii]|uniref:2413_t:CDS:1 n=1 Tax=Ambispora gerdemannii TaxID=144530 RepID=A0A9N9FEZ6_9GLOM|nr:2413_t:CDS:1 [Ambispora gerdemannii]